MRNKCLLTITLLLAFVAAKAQTQLPGKCTAFYPEVLLRSVVLAEKDAKAIADSRDFGQSRVPSVQKHWIVFSDRSDNVTYTEPNARSATFSKLSLNEEVRIAQIKNGFAQVYTEPQKSIEYPKISQFAECKGWIPMGKLLLWHSCPANNVGVYNKALLCVNLDDMGDGGKLYGNPNKEGGYQTLNTDMNFYFVMKRENGMALLSKFHTMEGTSNQVLYGWVGEASYVAWNQRSCLEPNWEEEAVGYFSKNKVIAKVYDSKVPKANEKPGTSWNFAEYSKTVSASSKGKDRYRMPANTLRFPILDGGNSTLYHCSSFGATGTAAGTSLNRYISGEDSKIRKSKEAVDKLSKINIAIVIDGTKSMEAYFPAVKDAILEGVNFFGKNDKVRFGVVIYRDYTDGEEGVLETFPMTAPNNPKLKDFLVSGGNYGVKSSKQDKTNAEALYYGIDSAIDFFKFNPDESNIMLVVGDCGNDRNDTKVAPETIVKKLADKNIHFMGFQVRSESDDAFTLFSEQLLNIMKNSVQMKYDRMWQRMSEADKKGAKKLTVAPVLEDDGYTISNNYQNELYIGAYRNPERKKAMDPKKLTTLMENAIMACSQTVDYQRSLLINSEAGGDAWGTTDAVTGQMIFDKEFVRSRLGDKDQDTDGKLLSFTGWTKKQDDSGRQFWKPVIFISSDEFNVLMTRLEPVNDAAVAKADNREPYINALKALIQSLVPDITDDEMNRKGYKEVMDLIAGLNESSQALKGRTIAEIASPHAVKQQEYMSLVSDFKRKFAGLRRIQSTKYTYVRDFNGTKYYWIPIDDLP